MIRVFVVDDHSVVREGVKRIIASTGDMEVAGEAGNGKEALQRISSTDYDVILLDLALPGMQGLDVLRALKVEKPALPVLVLSIYPEEEYALRVLKEGASGYLCKESVPSDLVKALRKVIRGGRHISDFLGERLAQAFVGDGNKLAHESLSNREFQVFRLLVVGKTVKEIGGELSLARTTVSSYRTRILEKVGVKTNAELIHYALKHQLVL